MCLAHFDIFHDLLLNRCPATWNLFLFYNKETNYYCNRKKFFSKYLNIIERRPLPTLVNTEKAIWSNVLSIQNEWMSEWNYVYLCTAHITSCLMAVYNSVVNEWDRMSACEGASGCRYQSIHDLTHPPNPCMKCEMKLEIDHNTRNYVCPTLFD